MRAAALVVALGVFGCRRMVGGVDSGLPDPPRTTDTAGPAETGDPSTDTDTDRPVRRWVQVSSYPCALDDQGFVECWHSSQWHGSNDNHAIPPNDDPVSAFYAPTARSVWGVRTSNGYPHHWFCGSGVTVDEDPLICFPSLEHFVGLGLHSGLTDDGRVVAWDGEQQFPGDREYILFNGAGRPVVLARDNTGFAQHGWGPLLEHRFDAGSTYNAIAQGGDGICVLDAEGAVTCAGPEQEGVHPEPVQFSNPPYVALDGGFWAVCARRADHVIECNDGSEHDFGPVLAMAVYSYDHFDDPLIADYTSTPRQGLGLCVITVDNAVRCHGDRYFPDVLAQLPPGDDL